MEVGAFFISVYPSNIVYGRNRLQKSDSGSKLRYQINLTMRKTIQLAILVLFSLPGLAQEYKANFKAAEKIQIDQHQEDVEDYKGQSRVVKRQ